MVCIVCREVVYCFLNERVELTEIRSGCREERLSVGFKIESNGKLLTEAEFPIGQSDQKALAEPFVGDQSKEHAKLVQVPTESLQLLGPRYA